MIRLLWLVVLSICLASCKGLAFTPTPQSTQRPSLVAGSEFVDEFTPIPVVTDTANQVIDSQGSITATLTPSLDPTATIEPTPEITATLPLTIGLFADLGFRPKPNGYSFANYGPAFSSDFTSIDARTMFASDAEFCFDPNRGCKDVRLQLQLFAAKVNQLIRGGHCDGITVTTLRFFEKLDRITQFRPTATVAYSVPLFAARRQIAYYWALQLPDPVAEAQWRSTHQTPNEILTQLRQAMAGDSPDPTTLLIYNWRGKPQGHSMTPYAAEYRGGDLWRVRVYDSNWPGADDRYVEFNTRDNTWSYYRGDNRRRTPANQQCGDSAAQTWCGTAQSNSLGAVPISVYTQTPLCRNLCRVPAKNGGPAHSLASIDPDSELLITDEAGRRLGVINNGPVAEIPDSFLSLLPGGLDAPAALVSHLPVTEAFTYTISRAGSADNAPPAELSIFGPGFAAVAADITLSTTERSQLVLAPDGRQLVYRSGVSDQAGFKLVLETSAASQSFDVKRLTIGAGDAVTLTINDARGQFSIDNSQNITRTFDFTYTLVTTGTKRVFSTSDVVIAPTARDLIDYGSWIGHGPITLTITSEITGAPLRTLLLNDSTLIYYLPLILN